VTPFSAILQRDMRLALRVGGGALMGVLFFLIVVTLVPFAVGPDLAFNTLHATTVSRLTAVLSVITTTVATARSTRQTH